MEKNKTGLELIAGYFTGFTAEQERQFAALEPLYREWNEKINVISRKDIDELHERHILHSLAIAAVYDFKPGQNILDLGTGGGFPGIPLAIFFPDVHFHLSDSIQKKLKVVAAIVEATGLKNVTVQHTRAEEITGRKFNFVVSRAVAPLGTLWKWSKDLLSKPKPGSQLLEKPALICLKGGDLAEEISNSGLKPAVWEIKSIFNRPYFEEKYILSASR
jgi:16S rRNA (guanine527-N7)-methyltransferase